MSDGVSTTGRNDLCSVEGRSEGPNTNIANRHYGVHSRKEPKDIDPEYQQNILKIFVNEM